MSKYQNLGRVTWAAASFLLLFTAFNSADNLAAKVLRDDSFNELGFYSMAALYLVFAISGFFSKAVVSSMPGSKKVPMFLGGMCYFIRILCFLLPATHQGEALTWSLVIASAMLNGFGAGLLWTAQGEYVTECATEETKGFYFSYFFIIFMVSQILGNLVAALVLEYAG